MSNLIESRGYIDRTININGVGTLAPGSTDRDGYGRERMSDEAVLEKMITVKDNYLTGEEHQKLYNIVTAEYFLWHFNAYKVFKHEKETNIEAFQFVHLFYAGSNVTSPNFKILEPILNKLKQKTLIKVKLNLNPYSQKLIVGAYHPDQSYKAKAAIYYLNTNNGYTQFKKGNEKINSVANRMIFFETDDEHRGTNSTDCKNRLVLNFNYF